MTNESTLTKLHDMRLNAMAEQFNEQLHNNKFNFQMRGLTPPSLDGIRF